MLSLTWLAGLLRRRRARLLGASTGVAIAVSLIAVIGSFISAAEATMTARSVGRVAVDWQVQVQPAADPGAVLQQIRASSSATDALPVQLASTTGFQAAAGGTLQSTGSGVAVGLPPGYETVFPGEIRHLVGAGTGVLLAQQTAANLHAQPGDPIVLGRAGLPPVDLRVDGVVELPQADSLFQKIGASLSSQPSAPPDNVVLMPASTWHQVFDPLAQARPDLVHSQVHVRLSHRLPANPIDAYGEVLGAARNLETRLAGAGVVGDNLGAALGAARSDAVYAQALFILLGLPGAILAALHTASIAAAGGERRRREHALLRTRGASQRQLFTLGFVESLLVGGTGVVLGLGAASVIGRLAFGTPDFGATPQVALTWAAGAAIVGMAIAAAAILVPTWREVRLITVTQARRRVVRGGDPGLRAYAFDAGLLALAASAFWLSGQQGYQLVLAPEGVPQISVDYRAFGGVALLWIGAGLLSWHLGLGLLGRGRGLVRGILRPVAAGLAGTVASSLARQRQPLARTFAIVALTIAFAASTAIFNWTYQQQARVDALLTNGADVRVTEPPGVAVQPSTGAALQKLSGVVSVEPLQHRFAYVGTDLQDLYGVRPETVVGATRLLDAYFTGGSAREMIGRLAKEPDGVLVSAETVQSFQLQRGDRLKLRLQDQRSGQYIPVELRYVGVVNEFPTAPKDSFLVANADYVARMTGSAAVATFLVNTDGAPPTAVADRVQRLVGTEAQVTSITDTRQIIGSSLTAVDLTALTRIELAFALVLAAAASGLVLTLGLIERRRMFAIAVALGARSRQLGAFVWAELAFVIVGGLIVGSIIGWTLSQVLVAVLNGVFDPPPSALAVPWGYLVFVDGLSVLAAAAVGSAALHWMRRSPISVIRDL